MPSPDPDLIRATLIKLALPIVTIALILFAARRRGISWRDGLGLRTPPWGQAALWLVAWGVWLALSEIGIDALGLDQAQPWPAYPMVVVVMRILAIGLLGPAAEEFVMRGLFLGFLQRTRLGPALAVVVVALAWAAMHYSYGLGTLALITIDGLWLGFARVKTGSLWVPIGMHAIGNLLSIAQSLGQ